ncbi:uncharacterized protein LOC129782619 isoform X2 [Falco peregrinus]|uniref:uncharacterized protein LOC129782619 isoform X2 n=1 Tax=Falco peregrinus TaxID=8954 RepID=UPI002479E769|nr:uncharacterized protein LOC129782619 isoform X2 [Falco peregrinus]
MADGGAEPQDEHLGGAGPPGPLPPSPSHNRALLLAEDITATKRPRLSLGTQASPGDPRAPGSRGGSGGGWGPRAGRVAGLYPQLLRELEVQELQQALAARDEVVLHRDRWIRQLELENRQLRSQVRSLEENDLLSSGGGRGGPLATAATTTGTLLASGTSCIGISDSNIPQGAGGAAGEQCHCAGWGASALLRSQPRGAGLCPGRCPPEPPSLEAVGRAAQWLPPLPGHQGGGWQPRCAHRYCLPLGGERGGHADGTPLWASPIEVSTDKPKLMTQRLLDYFWWETLARSSATGQHIAHNATMERPLRLPMAMVNAIKEHGTKLCGHGCNFNAVINSKCGRSWWAVRKVVME